MNDSEKSPPKWVNDSEVGLGGLKSSVKKTRDVVAATMEALQKEVDRHRAEMTRMRSGRR